MAEGKKKQQHIVVFQDEKGKVIKTAFAVHGESVTAPDLPGSKGSQGHYDLVFGGWDQDLSSITANLVVKAFYKKVPKKYLVMYFNEDGSVLGTEFVPYGSPAEEKIQPKKDDSDEFHYRFIGWDTDLSKIEKDTMARPLFGKIRRSYPVRFLDEDGRILKEARILYGRPAAAPSDPSKKSDPVFHYHFSGWDRPFDSITGPVDVRAVYESEYREYPVRIYEEDRLVSEISCHYGDLIEYPDLSRKGYTLTWTPMPDRVEEEVTIRGTYEFSNPAGKEFDLGNIACRIVNPSIEAGTVCLLRYDSEEGRVRIPEQVLIGDYYYRISEIDARAFCGCTAMEILEIPASVAQLHEEALSGCRRLKEINLGRGIRKIGKHAFSENTHLKKIVLESDTIRFVHRSAFERMDAPVVIDMRPNIYQKRFALFEKAMGSGAIIARQI